MKKLSKLIDPFVYLVNSILFLILKKNQFHILIFIMIVNGLHTRINSDT